MKICETTNFSGNKVAEEERGGNAGSPGADIPSAAHGEDNDEI